MLIYKICRRDEWAEAVRDSAYRGSENDRKDGFIHFSRAQQVPGTLAKYYADADDLVLVAVEADRLGAALIYEASRDGALFPHLYGPLPLSAVVWSAPLGRSPDGGFVVPPDCR